MNIGELANADIFFFITGIAVILVTTLLIIVLIYIAEILHDIRHVSKTVRKGGDHFTESVKHLIRTFIPKRKKK
jgi:hypothetical protein